MKITPEHNERMAKMTFSSVYPLYIKKIESKGRTKDELLQVIEWLTGFDDKKVQELIDEQITFKTFFMRAQLNPNAKRLNLYRICTGLSCRSSMPGPDLRLVRNCNIEADSALAFSRYDSSIERGQLKRKIESRATS